jgi:guanine deaminase
MHQEEVRSYLLKAVSLSKEGMDSGRGGPFGCIVVKDGQVLAEGTNRVTSQQDPTAHAEIVAIRKACHALDSFQLEGCVVFCSCEPCPMCLGALYWARPQAVFYVNTREDAAAAGFDDAFIYKEITMKDRDRSIPFEHVPLPEGLQVLKAWKDKGDKSPY